jgi:hypothetical protein
MLLLIQTFNRPFHVCDIKIVFMNKKLYVSYI